MGLELDKIIHYRCLTPVQMIKAEDKLSIYCPMCEKVIEEINTETSIPDFDLNDSERLQVHLWVAIPAYIFRFFALLGRLPLIRRFRKRTHTKAEAIPIIIQ